MNLKTLHRSQALFVLSLLPAEDRVELFGNVVVSVLDLSFPQPQDDVGVRLPIRVCWVEVGSLGSTAAQ